MNSSSIRLATVGVLLLVTLTVSGSVRAFADELGETGRSPELEGPEWQNASDGFVSNGDVRLHYVTVGSGPLVVMIHGFPDYWYTWRRQMQALSQDYQVVAIDQRGYNLSGQPEGVEAYAMTLLAGDVTSVIKHLGAERATIVGHDWGGAVAWTLAMQSPELVERLVILNLPHPRGLQRELAHNPQQQANSAYARKFQQADAAAALTPDSLAAWVDDPVAKEHYIRAFRRSSMEGMLNYYKANYPREPYQEATTPFPQVKCPVLMVHGLKDWALLPSGLNNTWEWIDAELTLVTIPRAGHFVQHDASDEVNRAIQTWLGSH